MTANAMPVRTWRWLGVNEPLVSADDGDPVQVSVSVPEGGSRESVVVCDSPLTAIAAEVGAGASLHLVTANLAGQTSRVVARVGRGGSLRLTALELAAGTSAAGDVRVSLDGDGSSFDLAAMYLVDGDGKLDLNYVVTQSGRRTDAAMSVSGALAGHADKVFRGTLDFRRGSSGSVGREREEVLLLSPDVRNRSVPLMLAAEDDVDGHHAVTIGKLDEERLFYLMTRGLSEPEARRLAVMAAAGPVLARLPQDSPLADRVTAALARSLGA